MLAFYIDRGINLCKWPVATVTLLGLPAAALVFSSVLMSSFIESMIWFWAGFVLYFILWNLLFKSRLWGSWLPTFEHELSHAIFAWLTFHRVTDFHASWSKGGHVRYIGGEGNWLITIAPYFFPLFPLLLLGLYLFQPAIFQGFFPHIMGFVFGFQGCSTWGEIHRKQPDLQKVGWGFSWCFLPTINLLSYAWVLSVLQKQKASKIWVDFWNVFLEHIEWVVNWIQMMAGS